MQYINNVHLLHRWKTWAKGNKADKIPLKEDDAQVIADLQARLEKATKKKETASTDQDRLSAAAMLEDAKAQLKLVRNIIFCCTWLRAYFSRSESMPAYLRRMIFSK